MRLLTFPTVIAGLYYAIAINSYADETDVIKVNPFYTVSHDNNLFRLPSGTPAPTTRDDTISNAGVVAKFDKRFSLQQVVGNVSWVDSRYRHNDYLNFAALNYDAKWLMAGGLRWSSELYVDRNQSLNSFADNRNILQRNVRVIENQHFNLDYWFHSNWHAVGGVNRTSLTNEQVFLEESDYDALGYSAGVRYQPRSGNTLTWRMKRYDAVYRKRQFNAVRQFDNGFTQTGSELNLRWQLSGKSALNGNLEYVDRRHEHFSSRDFAGWTGNLDYLHGYSGNSSFTFGYRHGLNSYQQNTSSYYISDELNLAAQLVANEKFSVIPRVGYAQRRYLGEITALPPGVSQRRDNIGRVSLDFNFKPARWAEVKAGTALERRLSNSNGLDYVDRVVFISMSATF